MAPTQLQEASRLVGEDLAFQRRVWRFQRIGWGAMALVVLLGMAGVFGGGPLAQASARSADGAIEAEWEWIERIGRDSQLRIRGLAPHRGPLELRLEGGLAGPVEISGIEPQPAGESRAPGRIWLRFDPPPEGERAEILLKLRSSRPGIVSGQLAIGEAAIPLRLVVLP
ncbi:hypothetical protein SAMN02745194_03036 [Roseomonas rosea]|uniref:Uncharacterized protein n=1 Tax=Muricoccus roseus TaxID=198092 RepID=A0A1M6KZJ0_9PROT|nr:hypothetical protein [Roseomonas rosea]SHJ64361.1 hypothetical protein SAMN02745194_03036 [Roseomonas rosea]